MIVGRYSSEQPPRDDYSLGSPHKPGELFRGLGDVVWWLLRWLPAQWKPTNCQCEARRAWLNNRFPFVQ